MTLGPGVHRKVPKYREVFLDEGDVDVIGALRVYKNGFDGGVTPDHAPQMSCAASWHAGMAYALDYRRAVITMIESEEVSVVERSRA